MCVFIHIHMYMCLHTHISFIFMSMYTSIYTHPLLFSSHSCFLSDTHTDAHTKSRKHTHAHTRIHTHKNINAHAHTHTYTLVRTTLCNYYSYELKERAEQSVWMTMMHCALQCVTVRCNVLQCAAGRERDCFNCISVQTWACPRGDLLQCSAMCCSVLQCIAVCCRTGSAKTFNDLQETK